MYIFSTQGKTISIFPGLEATGPIIYLNTFSGEGQKVMRLYRLPAAHHSLWWPSAIWIGITIWYPGTARLLKKMLPPAPVVRTIICSY